MESMAILPLIVFIPVIIQGMKFIGMHRVPPSVFQKIIDADPTTAVIIQPAGIFNNKTRYITNIRGLNIYTVSKPALELPNSCIRVHSFSDHQ